MSESNKSAAAAIDNIQWKQHGYAGPVSIELVLDNPDISEGSVLGKHLDAFMAAYFEGTFKKASINIRPVIKELIYKASAEYVAAHDFATALMYNHKSAYSHPEDFSDLSGVTDLMTEFANAKYAEDVGIDEKLAVLKDLVNKAADLLCRQNTSGAFA